MVVLLADSVRNYMTKFLNDSYMVEHGFMEVKEMDSKLAQQPWAAHTVSQLNLATPLTVAPTMSAEGCMKLFKDEGIDQLPVLNDDNTVMGVITLGNLSSQVFSG